MNETTTEEVVRDKTIAEVVAEPLSKEEAELFDDLFTYHAPTGDQAERYAAINGAAKALAVTVHRVCPPSADRSAAIRLIREARMTANASIATRTGGSYR